MSTARDAILGRVKQALARPAEHHHHETITTGPVFPLPEPTPTALTERFQAEFAAIQGECLPAESFEAARGLLHDWLFRNEVRTLMVVDDSALRRLFAGIEAIRWVSPQHVDKSAWDQIDLGATRIEALVAESGTIVVSAGQSGRATSILPPIHLAIATADQLVPDLETAMARLRQRYSDRLPSAISFISGPSRTADIEKILVLGAHGPKRLALLILPPHALDE